MCKKKYVKIDLRNEIWTKQKNLPFVEDANVSRNKITVKHSIIFFILNIIFHSLILRYFLIRGCFCNCLVFVYTSKLSQPASVLPHCPYFIKILVGFGFMHKKHTRFLRIYMYRLAGCLYKYTRSFSDCWLWLESISTLHR